MASVRAIASFNEQNPRILTFKYDGSIVYDASNYDLANHSAQVGKAVAIVSDSTVGLGSAGNVFAGRLLSVEQDGFCTVQVGGTMMLPAAASNPPLVGRLVTVDGAGNVSSAAGGATLGEAQGNAQVYALGTDPYNAAQNVAWLRRA